MKLFNIFCPMDSEFNSVVKVIRHLLKNSKKIDPFSIEEIDSKNSYSFGFYRKNSKIPTSIVVTKTGMSSFNITNALWRRQVVIRDMSNSCSFEHDIKDIQFLLVGYCGAVDPDYHVGDLLRVEQVLNLNDHFVKYGLLGKNETIDCYWSNPYFKEKDMLDTFRKKPGLKTAVTMECPFLINSQEHKKTLSRYADIVDQESYSFIHTIESMKNFNMFKVYDGITKVQAPQILRLVSDAVDEPFDYSKQDEYSKMLRHQLYKVFPDMLGL